MMSVWVFTSWEQSTFVNHVTGHCTCLYGFKGVDCVFQWAPTSALKDGDTGSKLNPKGSAIVWLHHNRIDLDGHFVSIGFIDNWSVLEG
jgi:hypothetical protein